MRLACERHIRDLETGLARGLRFDADAAAAIIQFFEEVLFLPESPDGAAEPAPFIPSLFQRFILGSLFGWKGEDGYRRFRTAYIEIGKGSGKTPLGAGIGLYCLVADDESGAQIFAAANTQDQAKLCWSDADKMGLS